MGLARYALPDPLGYWGDRATIGSVATMQLLGDKMWRHVSCIDPVSQKYK